MVTAVDIVQRLGAVDEARIREELAGNLCRCTGYRGIVRAIAEVAAGQTARLARVDTPPPATPTPRPTSATHGLPTIAPVPPAVMAGPDPAISQPRGTLHAEAHNATDLPHRITHRQAIALPLEEAWARLSDPARAAACLPGAQLTRHEGDALEGEIVVALGPITTRLAGTGTLRLDAATHTARMTGQGRDGGNTARGEIAWRLTPAVEGCVLHLDIGWRLTGPLAQFSRPALLRGLVTAIAAEFAHNLATGAQAARPGLLSLFRLWWRGLFSR